MQVTVHAIVMLLDVSDGKPWKARRQGKSICAVFKVLQRIFAKLNHYIKKRGGGGLGCWGRKTEISMSSDIFGAMEEKEEWLVQTSRKANSCKICCPCWGKPFFSARIIRDWERFKMNPAPGSQSFKFSSTNKFTSVSNSTRSSWSVTPSQLGQRCANYLLYTTYFPCQAKKSSSVLHERQMVITSLCVYRCAKDYQSEPQRDGGPIHNAHSSGASRWRCWSRETDLPVSVWDCGSPVRLLWVLAWSAYPESTHRRNSSCMENSNTKQKIKGLFSAAVESTTSWSQTGQKFGKELAVTMSNDRSKLLRKTEDCLSLQFMTKCLSGR